MKLRLIAFAGCLMLGCGVVQAQGAKDRGADASRSPKTQPKFELKDGDRVVFLGNTLIEREQKYGYWETMLTARYPDRKIIFRNLGWDGDTVWAESRGLFDPPAKGYERMLARIAGIKPTVIFIGYGNNEAYAGKKGLPAFIKQYNKLLDDLTKVSAKGMRFVLLSPIPLFRKAGARWKLPPVEIYAKSIGDIAVRRGTHHVDFYAPLKEAISEDRPLPLDPEGNSLQYDRNGIHLSAWGYETTARVLSDEFFGKSEVGLPKLLMSSNGKVVESKKLRIYNSKQIPDGLRWQQTPGIYFPLIEMQYLTVTDLKPGKYELRRDGVSVGFHIGKPVPRHTDQATNTDLAERVIVRRSEGHFDNRLRQAIIAKNRLYFHSWRPQNITYLFLFRKHEQGQNAKEVKEFERLVAEKEQEIDRLKKPVTRTYELIRVKEKK